MNLFDIAVVSIIGICLISGGFRGLIREVSGIIGLVAGFYGANTYYLKLAPYAAQWIDNTAARHLICFFVLFFGILILVGLLGPADTQTAPPGFSGLGGPHLWDLFWRT